MSFLTKRDYRLLAGIHPVLSATVQLAAGMSEEKGLFVFRVTEGLRTYQYQKYLVKEGADYNRTYIQDVFLGKKEKGGIVWQTAMATKLGKTSGYKIEEFAEAAKAVFDEGLQIEPELTEDDTRYVYRDAMGTVLPYPKRALEINPSLKVETKASKKEKAA